MTSLQKLDRVIDDLDRSTMGTSINIPPLREVREEIERMRKTLRVLGEHEPSWPEDFLRARVALGDRP